MGKFIGFTLVGYFFIERLVGARVLNRISNAITQHKLAERRSQIAGQTGHHASGIQRHSAGPVFPIVIRSVGNGIQAMDPAGPCGPLHYYRTDGYHVAGQTHADAYAAAERDARIMLECGS